MSKRNHSIDIFRYICSIMVVAIHTHPFEDIDERLSYVFTYILPRVAVPFFFIVAGYFYINNLEKQNAFKLYIKRIVKIYALWSLPYFAIDYIQWGHQTFKGFIAHIVYSFLITGSHYHFWYFPALIFSVCITTIIYKINLNKILIPVSILLYCIGCLGCSYHSLGMRTPILCTLYSSQHFTLIRRVLLMAFPFFSAGLLVKKIENYINNKGISKTALFICLLITALCWLVEIILVISFHLHDNIIITFGLFIFTVAIMVLLLQYPMPNMYFASQKAHILADFTYYVHPLIIGGLTAFTTVVCNIIIPQTVLFILVIAITWVGGTMIMYYKKYSTRRMNTSENIDK